MDLPGDHWVLLVTSVASGFGPAFDEFSKLMNPLETLGKTLTVFMGFQIKPKPYLHVKLCTWFASYLL